MSKARNLAGFAGSISSNNDLNVGVVTASGFVGNLTGDATGLSGTPNINVGVVTANTELDVGVGGTVITALSSTGGVGIGTTNPRFLLEVGSVGSAGTQFLVNGDARIVGILTIGAASITIDPSDNAIKLSNDTILRRDNDSGDIRFLDDSGNLKKIIANEIRVGSGSSSVLIKHYNGTVKFRNREDTRDLVLENDFNSSGVITATSLIGSGSGITGLNASNLSSGTIPAARFAADSNAYGTRTVSSSDPSSGNNGDIWLKV